MKFVIKRSEATQIEEHGMSTFTEYAFDSKNIALGVSEIKGRYPAKGWDVDTEIDQIWFVKSGSCTLHIADETYECNEGDMIHLPKNTPYVIDGKVTLVVASSPAWTIEQHRHRD